MGSKCSIGHLFHLVRTFAVLLERPKKERPGTSAVLEVDFCLFVFVWVLFVLNYDRRAKDIKRLQWACSRGNSSPDLLLHTMCSFQHLCPSNRRLSWIYQGSCILNLFKHCVMACSSGRLQVQHTGGSWGKKDDFYPVSTWAQLKSFTNSWCDAEALNVSQSQTGHSWVYWGLILLAPLLRGV